MSVPMVAPSADVTVSCSGSTAQRGSRGTRDEFRILGPVEFFERRAGDRFVAQRLHDDRADEL